MEKIFTRLCVPCGCLQSHMSFFLEATYLAYGYKTVCLFFALMRNFFGKNDGEPVYIIIIRKTNLPGSNVSSTALSMLQGWEKRQKHINMLQ